MTWPMNQPFVFPFDGTLERMSLVTGYRRRTDDRCRVREGEMLIEVRRKGRWKKKERS